MVTGLPRLVLLNLVRLACPFVLASAVGAAWSQSTFKTGEIARVFPSGNGTIAFRLKGDDCHAGGNDYYTFDAANVASKSWLAILLTAASTGRQVTVAVPACGGAGNKAISYLFQDF